MSRLIPARIPISTVGRHFTFEVIRLVRQESEGGEMLVPKYHVVEYSMSAYAEYKRVELIAVSAPYHRSADRCSCLRSNSQTAAQAIFASLVLMTEAQSNFTGRPSPRAPAGPSKNGATTIPLRLTERQRPLFHSTCSGLSTSVVIRSPLH